MAKLSAASYSDCRISVASRAATEVLKAATELGMEISSQSLLAGARRATGTVAIIDVFRAWPLDAVLRRGAGRPVRDPRCRMADAKRMVADHRVRLEGSAMATGEVASIPKTPEQSVAGCAN